MNTEAELRWLLTDVADHPHDYWGISNPMIPGSHRRLFRHDDRCYDNLGWVMRRCPTTSDHVEVFTWEGIRSGHGLPQRLRVVRTAPRGQITLLSISTSDPKRHHRSEISLFGEDGPVVYALYDSAQFDRPYQSRMEVPDFGDRMRAIAFQSMPPFFMETFAENPPSRRP